METNKQQLLEDIKDREESLSQDIVVLKQLSMDIENGAKELGRLYKELLEAQQ